MPSPSKIVNIDALGYTLTTEAAGGVAQDEITLSASGAAVELTAGLTKRRRLFIKVLSGEGDVFIGPSGVTTSNGYLLEANDEMWLEVGPSAAVYGRAGATASKVRVLEISSGGTSAPTAGSGTPAKIVNIDDGGYAGTTQAGGTIDTAQIDVNKTDTSNRVLLTAGVANRRKMYIKVMGDDVADQRYIYVAGSNVKGGGITGSIGIPIWARYELVLDVGPSDALYALVNKSVSGDPLDVRVLEIG